jgi:NADH:ubiquinone oxidoreductase subunit K
MKIIKNEGSIDRVVRLILAVVLFLVGVLSLNGAWQILFYILSVVMLITAILGFCGLYKLFGIDTNTKK